MPSLRALRAQGGSLLVFLPGAGEIRRTETLLRERIEDKSIDIVALYGALDASVQDRAISPARPGTRKIVLATSIAETSLTIEGVRIVIDCGLARVPRYEPDVGLTRLETVRVSRASADQRRGRAGRTEPGFCFRLWDEPETASLEPFARPEILAADLSSFALDLAQWGVSDPGKLSFLDPPPQGAFSEAKSLLRNLTALDADGRITEEGRKLRALPLQPRLARMIVDAGREGAGGIAADMAAILSERGLGGNDVDLTHRLDQFRRERSGRAEDARRMAKRWAEEAGGKKRRRSSHRSAPFWHWLIPTAWRAIAAAGRAVSCSRMAVARRSIRPPALAREPFIVVAELTGTAAQGRILLAAPIAAAEIEQRFKDEIESRDEVTFDPASASLRARKARKLGAIALSEQIVAVKPDEATARILSDGAIKLGLDRLPWTKALSQWREREMFLRKAEGEEWPDLSDAALAARAEEWLTPLCDGKTNVSAVAADDLWNAVTNLLPWNLRRRLDEEAPTHFEAPTGTQAAIDYGAEAGPTISIRVQELFGLAQHPSIAGGRVPLVIELLSPAHRPVQVTRDLPGFWRGSWQAVKSDMKGRYPRHPWPDDPASALPTRRAKPRGQ